MVSKHVTLSIEDVLTALDLVATKSEALGHVYNVGTEVAISLIN